MRNCPVCLSPLRSELFVSAFKIPDTWTLPSSVYWYKCDDCSMIYGDGNMNQTMFDTYYRTYYGYGVNTSENIERLTSDAKFIAELSDKNAMIVDFGGAGDNGDSILAQELKIIGYKNVHLKSVGDMLPVDCNVIYASHILEHIYDLESTMQSISRALDKKNGLLIIDVPDATGLLLKWKAPIIDFTTKHLNHFTLRNLLMLGHRFNFESIKINFYELNKMPACQVYFRIIDVAEESFQHINENTKKIIKQIEQINYPVNIWGLSDLTWYILSKVNLEIIDYIDNDPAYRNSTYDEKQVLEKPTNDAPILVLAQIQKRRLVENIRNMGIDNKIIIL